MLYGDWCRFFFFFVWFLVMSVSSGAMGTLNLYIIFLGPLIHAQWLADGRGMMCMSCVSFRSVSPW